MDEPTIAGLTTKDVEDIALLARLELTPDEVETLRGELSAILEHIGTIRDVDTDGVEPMTHAIPMQLRLRSDEPDASLSVEDAVGQAADSHDGQFRVPNIIETAGR